MQRRWVGVILSLSVAVLLLSMAVRPLTAHAQNPLPDGVEPDGGDTGADGEDRPGPVQTIVNQISHVMTFPIETMTSALTQSLNKILAGAIEDAGAPFAAAIEAVVFGGVAHGPGEEIYGPPWRVLRNVSVALWPLTLGLVVVWAARGGVADNPVSFAELQEGVIQWALSVVLALSSALVAGWGLKLAGGITSEILMHVWGSVTASSFVGVFFNTVLWSKVLRAVPGAALFYGVFMLIFAFSLLTALIFAYVARYALLFLLISVAPLLITLGVVPQIRWLFWLWMKGMVVALLLGPANALLLKLAHLAAVSGVSDTSAFGGIVKFLTAAAMLSVLITIDYAVIQAVFGAALEIAQKTKGTVQGVATGLVALGGMVLSGGVAGAGLGGAAALEGGLLGGAGGGSTTAAAAARARSLGGAGGMGTGAAGAGAAAEVTTKGGEATTATNAPGTAGSGTGSRASTRPPGPGAEKTRQALHDPAFLQRMGTMLNTVGQSGVPSRNPVIRAAAGAARGVGSALRDRGRRMERGSRDRALGSGLLAARREARTRAEHRGWPGLLAANGIDAAPDGLAQMSRSLSRLADRYGGGDVRQAAPDVIQTMAAAQQRGGIGLAEQAQAAGYESPAEYLGGEVEQRIWARTGRPIRDPVFPTRGGPSPDAWGAGPSWHDYRVGADLARMIGREGADNIDAYARITYRLRDPALGAGRDAVDRLYSAAGEAREAGRQVQGKGGWRRSVWPHFARRIDSLAQDQGLEHSDLPTSWIAEQQFLASYAADREPSIEQADEDSDQTPRQGAG